MKGKVVQDDVVKDLAAVAIYVSDLASARTFYVETLGLTLEGEMPPGITLKAGRATIYLEGGRTPRQSADSVALVSPAFEASSVRACFGRLKDAGVRIVEE